MLYFSRRIASAFHYLIAGYRVRKLIKTHVHSI
jgi:hypothetical protein